MSNFLKTFAPFIIAILFGSLTFAFAQKNGETKTGLNGDRPERRMPPEGRGGGLHPRMLEWLNLTDEQKQQIEAIHQSSREASKENFDKMRGFDEQLREAVEGDFNEAQARAILSEKAQVQIELELNRLRSDAQILKILTAEQKAQLERLKQQRREPPMRGGGFRPAAPPMN